VSDDPKSLLNRERSDTTAALSARTKSVAELASFRGVSFRRSFADTLDLLTPSDLDDRRLTTLLSSSTTLTTEFVLAFDTDTVAAALLFTDTDEADEIKTGVSFNFDLFDAFDETADLSDTEVTATALPETGLDEITFDLPELTPANLGEPKICLSRSPPLFDLAFEIMERITSSFLISCQPGTASSLAIDPSCFAVNALSSADVAMMYP
jgi:hypothetical protein